MPNYCNYLFICSSLQFECIFAQLFPCVGVCMNTHTHTVGTDEYKCPLVHSFFCFWAAGFVAAAVPIASIWALPCLALNRLGLAGLGWAFFYRLHNACSLPFISCMCVCVCDQHVSYRNLCCNRKKDINGSDKLRLTRQSHEKANSKCDPQRRE